MRVPAVAAVLLALAFAGAAPAQSYIFTNIADSTGPVNPAVNPPSINAGGTAAFVGAPDAGGLGIFTSSGGPTTTIADLSGPFNGFSDPFINAGGTVAFFATLDLGGLGIFTGNGGPTTTIADDSGPFSNFGPFPSINAGGTVAFSATLDLGGSGIFTGNGGPTTSLYNTAGPFSEFFDPALDAGGTVAFRATLDLGGEGIFTGNGGPTTTIADTAGPFSQFFDPALNAGGAVAFRAFLDASGFGIFTGPDPVSDAVIRTGDTLFGGTVTNLSFSRNGLNDSGQVVFYYELDNLANGVLGIAVATPVPEPASLLLGLLGAGLLWWRRRWA